VSNKILLLEDDLLFAETLTDLLEEEGYDVSHYPNGQDALDAIYENKFSIYLFDINVPLIDGVSLLRDLRDAKDHTPAIFLTSHREKEMLQHAFRSGCDDFLIKPFDNTELLLRMQAIRRRVLEKERQCVGRLSYDIEHMSIYYDDKPLDLSKKEYELLVLLMNHINEIVPKEMIYDALWTSAEGGGSDGAIRVYINRLKQLLPSMSIENIRGIGYRLVSLPSC